MPVSSYCNEGEHRACSNRVSCEEGGWTDCRCVCHDRQKALIVDILPHLNIIEAETRLIDNGECDKHAAVGNILSELDFARRALAFPGIDTDYEEPDRLKGDEDG